MAFNKTGSPVKFNIVSSICSICGNKSGIVVINNGKSICQACQKQATENK